MMISTIAQSPKQYARFVGFLYLMVIISGMIGALFIRGPVIVAGDAVSTLENIVSGQSMWRFGIALEIISFVCVTGMAVIYFFMFNPVHKELNMMAMLLRVAATFIQFAAILNIIEVLYPIGHAEYLKAFSHEQLSAMVFLGLKSHTAGFNLALLIFGLNFFLHGYLIIKSTFLPKTLGVLIQFAGLGYFTNSALIFFFPSLSSLFVPYILLPCLIGEFSLCLWFLFKGVDEDKWKALATKMDQTGLRNAVAPK